jgi:dissimilatory sulfite reductase (desulfoviridin) alpha/beta subunit
VADQFALKNNQIFVLAEAAGGVYNSDQLRVLCEVADNESAFLKITEDQRIGFMVDPHKLADVQGHVRKSGLLLRSYKSSGVPSPRACLGELCTFAHQPSLGDALELTTHLLKSFPAPKRYSSIGINGCQRACLGSSTEDIHVVAEESGYKISIGGKGSDISQQAQLILENVPRSDLPQVIEKILAVFYQESQENERIFDVIERIGLSPFFNALPEHLTPHIQQPAETPAAESNFESTAGESIGVETQQDADAAIETSVQADASVENLAVALDDLLEITDSELNPPTPSRQAQTEENSLQANTELADLNIEPMQNEPEIGDALIDPDLIPAEPMADISLPEGEGEQFADGLAGELLEVADSDLEEGSLEDVERVRDAIRTELSMASAPEQTIRPNQTDLLDEISESGVESSEFIDIDSSASEDMQDAGEIPVVGDDEFGLLASDTAADIEHQKPRALEAEEIRPASQQSRRSSPLQAQPPVGGRLSIRFEGEQLAVELPSGLSFELPFESVGEDGQFAMSLPDGELRLSRNGHMLAVSLGMLNLKIPIPATIDRQVA